MKQLLMIGCVLGCTYSIAQSPQQTQEAPQHPTLELSPISYELTPKLIDLEPYIPQDVGGKEIYTVPNKMRRNKYVNEDNAFPKGEDPVWQKDYNQHHNRAPIKNWEGQTFSAFPPDPSGAAGPNHYVQMVNSTYAIYNKNGNLLYGPTALGSLLGGGNDGDPIVMYDKAADRWFLSQFAQTGNKLIIAISQTPDPLGAYHKYEYSLDQFPDYPKYSVWTDAYYVTANKGGNPCYALERAKMLVGDNTAKIVGFNLTSIQTPGFFSAIPAHASSTLPPAGTPGYIFYFQDDAWGGVTQDHIKIWQISLNWTNTAASTISAPQQLNVSAFDSQFQSTWDDISQQGSSQKLDAVPGAFMYMAHYREINGYGAIVLNHTVDVNGNDRAGIRWYELRKTGSNPWTLAQEGTFSPTTDGNSRWMGSIAMDNQGNIGLAYNISGSTKYPSIYYTGRYASDAPGTMTLAEQVIIDGTSAQSGANRWGDYAQLTIDPTDDATFWYTGEYVAGSRKSRIASFKIANDFQKDVGVVSINTPVSGSLTATETIGVTLKNFGTQSQSNFPVKYQVNGGAAVSQNYTGTLAAGATANMNFTTTANMSTPGNYTIKSYTQLTGDQAITNDTTTKTVQHTYSNNVGVSVITAPTGTSFTATENVTITINNYGSAAQSNIPVFYRINGGTPVSGTYTGTIAAGGNASYTFPTQADITALGNFTFKAYTAHVGDLDLSNDTTTKVITHSMCAPTSDCSYGDGFTEFQIGGINNSTACSPSGYGDYTSMSTVLLRGSTNTLSIQSGYANQSASVWIDFNDNFNFEASERVVINFPFGTTMATTNVNIPANANLGEHLMRARTNWNNTGNSTIDDPCVTVQYGETEDYKVVIDQANEIMGTEESVSLNITQVAKGQFQIALNGETEPVQIEVHNSIGQRVYFAGSINLSNAMKTIDISENAPGYYLIRVSNAAFSKVEKVTFR